MEQTTSGLCVEMKNRLEKTVLVQKYGAFARFSRGAESGEVPAIGHAKAVTPQAPLPHSKRWAVGSGAGDDLIFSWRKLFVVWPWEIGDEMTRVRFGAGVRRSFPKLLLNHADPKAVYCPNVSKKRALMQDK